jgi:hypothetical protein
MIPLFLGVTGHRSFDSLSVPDVRDAIHREFHLLRQRYPRTQIIVLSPLAEGADRLVVEVALGFNCEVWAVLPTSVVEYIKDFPSTQSKKEFRRLLGQASQIINSSLLAGRAENFSVRPTIYEHLGDQLCQMSHFLMALWDGAPTEKPGGTSSVIRSFLSSSFNEAGLPRKAKPACRPVIHISVTRGHATTRKMQCVVSWLAAYPSANSEVPHKTTFFTARDKFLKTIDQLNAFNAASQFTHISTAKLASKQLLTKPYPWQTDPTIVRWIEWFLKAEQVSYAAGRYRLKNLMIPVGLIALFLSASVAYSHHLQDIWPVALGLTSLAVLAMIYSKYKMNEAKELGNGGRIISEYLRYAISLRTGGNQHLIPHDVAENRTFVCGWVSIAFRAIDNFSRIHPTSKQV